MVEMVEMQQKLKMYYQQDMDSKECSCSIGMACNPTAFLSSEHAS